MKVEILRYAAFTDGGTGGNLAGVVINADALTPARMLAIAKDIGYSETAFVRAGADGVLELKYFSPLAEVAFCGHATVATAVALAERHGPGDLKFATLAGPVTVRTARTEEGMTATLVSPPAATRPATSEEVQRTLHALGWSSSDIDEELPAHVAFAGNHHLVLAVRTRERLAELDYNFEQLGALMEEFGWTTVDLVFRESSTVFHARNPFPPGGVVEDPATGAAAAAFGGYLRALGLVDLPARVTVLQGQDMGLPSRLLIDLDGSDDRVRVTGTATELEPASGASAVS